MNATATPKPTQPCDCLMPQRGGWTLGQSQIAIETCQRCRRPLRGVTEGLHRPAPVQIKR
ncbi:MAG: hypothetical protein E6Q97_31555 [Desulfurellales bacterium]|nr:MAG: hypothetical protein E6Q97_31555 [Desulfurellales bacterium]